MTAGRIVQNYADLNLSAGRGIAVPEFPLKTGFADYLLHADGKAIGVVEAQPVGHSLIGVETQSTKYLDRLPMEAAAHNPGRLLQTLTGAGKPRTLHGAAPWAMVNGLRAAQLA